MGIVEKDFTRSVGQRSKVNVMIMQKAIGLMAEACISTVWRRNLLFF